MNDQELVGPEHIRAFLENKGKLKLSLDKSQYYNWIATKLQQTQYLKLRKKDKSTVQEYLRCVTGYSRQQLTRLISSYKSNKCIKKKHFARPRFMTKYTRSDILLLVKTDKHHDVLCGNATKKLFERAYIVHNDPAYERLSQISVSHIYNLRQGKFYQRQRHTFTKTKSIKSNIGTRRKPKPNGIPGYIRIDTVHQGDLDKKKGVYHINAVDEVTQIEVIYSVERICENLLIPGLKYTIALSLLRYRRLPKLIGIFSNFLAHNKTPFVTLVNVNTSVSAITG